MTLATADPTFAICDRAETSTARSSVPLRRYRLLRCFNSPMTRQTPSNTCTGARSKPTRIRLLDLLGVYWRAVDWFPTRCR
jgi:hypothetical protein